MSIRCRLRGHDWEPASGGELLCRRCPARYVEDDSGAWRTADDVPLRQWLRDWGRRINRAGQNPHDKPAQAVFIVLLVVIAAPLVLLWPYGEPAAPRTDTPDYTGAKLACESFVHDRLKAPRTAEFASLRQVRAGRTADGQIAVRGWVDAQNSFGAMLRHEYLCVLRDAGDRWQLDDIAVLPR